MSALSGCLKRKAGSAKRIKRQSSLRPCWGDPKQQSLRPPITACDSEPRNCPLRRVVSLKRDWPGLKKATLDELLLSGLSPGAEAVLPFIADRRRRHLRGA